MSKIMTLKEAKETLEYAYDHKAITGIPIDGDIIDVLEYAVESLTPPTEEEMCDILGKYYDTKVLFDEELGDFYYECSVGNSTYKAWIADELGDLYYDKPEFLIMLGMFLKGGSNE